MKPLVAAFVILALSVPTLISADECTKEWLFTVNGDRAAKIRQCVYKSGRSGYYELENLKGYTARMCFTIKFNKGTKFKGCRTMDAYEESAGSCFSCAPRNSGVKDIELTLFERR